MSTKYSMNLMIGALMSMSCLHGCAGVQPGDATNCGDLAAPRSYKVYLFVSKESVPNEGIVQTLEYRTNMSLLKQGYEVETIKDAEDMNSDGLLLRIDLVGIVQEPTVKRIGVQYVLINNSTKEVMHYKYEEIGPFVSYSSAVNKIGRNIAREVDVKMKCIQERGKIRS